MFSNPVTSIIGMLYLLCPVFEFFVPEAAGLCSKIQGDLIGIGFLSTADGIKTRLGKVAKANPTVQDH